MKEVCGVKTPCLDCGERASACWGRCEKYQNWKRETARDRKRDEALEYHDKQVQRAIKRRRTKI